MAVFNETNKKKWTKGGNHYYFKCYYTDIYGNRKQKRSKMYKTSKLAKEAEKDFLDSLNISNLSDFDDKNISFETFYNNWLQIKKTQVKKTTYYRIKKGLDKHILTYFKTYKLHNINITVINDWLNEMNKKNISLEYINKIIGYLQEILRYAKDNYNFNSKVANNLYKYKINVSNSNKKSSEFNFWDYDTFKKFIDNVDDEFYNLIFTFLYFTGLRIGEMIALNWNDIDFEKQTVNICKSFTNKTEDAKWEILDPKTKNSFRTIDIDNELMQKLLEHYKNESRIYKFTKDMFVFGNAKHVAPTTLRRKLDHYIKLSEVSKLTLHGFRHSHVSFLIDLGADSRDVAERVGDTIQMIEKTYYHMFPHKKSNTVNIINNFKNEKNST